MLSQPGVAVTLASRVTLSPECLAQHLSGEAVLLDLHGETYYGLNEVGSRLWELLAANPSLGAAHTQLVEEFDVAPEQLESDLVEVVRQMSAAGLVTVA